MKKILVISGWSLCGAAIIFLTGFALHQHDDRATAGIDIAVERKTDQYFVSEDDVKTMLIRNGFGLNDQPISSVDIPTIEQLVLADPGVENCDACITVEGKVYIRILQRRPIARLTNLSGESYYMDDRGKLMPTNENYTAPVLIVNGYFADSYVHYAKHDFSTISADSALKTVTVLDNIWNIVKAIDADSFLKAQMVQIYLSPENGFEMIPRVGDHKIIFGDAENIDGKFRKLHLFYVYGLGKTGRWSEYSSIDLRYKNQVVCTKKPTANGI